MKKLIVCLFLMLPVLGIAKIHKIQGFDLIAQKEVDLQLDLLKPRVFYFLSAWCPCSQGTFDHLNSLQKKFPQFQFVGFHSSVEIDKADAIKYFSKYKINFPIILDKKITYADKVKALKTPHVFIFGKDDELLFQGGATNSRLVKNADKFYLQEALNALAKGKEVIIKNAKTIGCYIQR